MNLSKPPSFVIPSLIAVGGLFLFVKKYFAKSVSANNLNVKVTGLKLKNKPSIEVTIRNPYTGEINFQNLTGDIIFNGNSLGTLFFNTPTIIPSNQVIKINIPIKINPLDAAGILIDLASKNKDQIKTYFKKGNLKIDSTITAENILFPFKQNFNF